MAFGSNAYTIALRNLEIAHVLHFFLFCICFSKTKIKRIPDHGEGGKVYGMLGFKVLVPPGA